ncbi:MAG TPA: PIG-L deacetylase family protein [Aquabacterium sp.]|nr:PIG-L deacetylase family protein [Aquabacterium sp.]
MPWHPLPEQELVPYQPLGTLGIGALLVLAPHPDDEVFGCGGLLALAVAQGVRVHVVVVSDGAAGGDAAQREQECLAAAREIGYLTHDDALQFWRLPDRGVAPDEALVQRIVQAIGHGRVDWVLAPSPFEIHPDHRAVCAAAIEACRLAHARLAFCEIGQALMANCLIDITAVLPIKQRAMQCFTSQLAVQDYGEQVTALNRYRSYTLGPTVTHAEAFCLVDAAVSNGGLEAVLGAVQQQLDHRFSSTVRPPG